MPVSSPAEWESVVPTWQVGGLCFSPGETASTAQGTWDGPRFRFEQHLPLPQTFMELTARGLGGELRANVFGKLDPRIS